MEFHGNFRGKFHRKFHGIPFHFPWNSMEFFINIWRIIEFYESEVDGKFHGIPSIDGI
jgi:hypothetical protein